MQIARLLFPVIGIFLASAGNVVAQPNERDVVQQQFLKSQKIGLYLHANQPQPEIKAWSDGEHIPWEITGLTTTTTLQFSFFPSSISKRYISAIALKDADGRLVEIAESYEYDDWSDAKPWQNALLVTPEFPMFKNNTVSPEWIKHIPSEKKWIDAFQDCLNKDALEVKQRERSGKPVGQCLRLLKGIQFKVQRVFSSEASLISLLLPITTLQKPDADNQAASRTLEPSPAPRAAPSNDALLLPPPPPAALKEKSTAQTGTTTPLANKGK
jgi:hypothetical protein